MEDYYASTLAAWTSLHGACSYASLSDLLSAANEPPFNLQFHHRDVRPLKEAYASIFRYVGPDRQPRRSGGRIRIACLVTLQHEVGFLRLIWDTLKRLDSDAFELIILCMSSAVSKFRAAMRNRDVTVVPIPEQPNRIIEAVSEERPDILYYFEVGTDAINYFLPFFRIAPVQCTSWGIQVTSGIPNVDYYLSNELVEPADGQDHYSEKLICARTLLSYQLPVRRPAPGKTRAAFGFSAEHDVYLLPQHLGKFHPDFDPALADILRRDPAGLIAIISDRFGHGANKLRERFHAVMPDVSNRVVFLPKQTVPDYLSLLDAADVLLDPPHFGGVTTTYDSLSLDKPIVTLPSAFHRGRYTYGCYRKMQLDDCVAVNLEDYVEKALKLGRHADYREFVVGRIREAKGRLFEDADAVRELERIFRLLLEEASP
jgi:predicted O-linked N-acetylglucosamine transferase (SPINDLY family)